MLDTLGLPLEDLQYAKYVNSMFRHCDVDGSGSISFREFMKLFRKVFVVSACVVLCLFCGACVRA